MIEKYHNPIFALISEKGALGVNELAKATDFPLSTIQRYLTVQQTYFKKTQGRKWDLPERVNSDITDDSLNLAVNITEDSIKLIRAQLTDALNAVENALIPLSTVKRGIKHKPTPVAPKVNSEKLQDILEAADKIPTIIKSKKENLTPEMYDTLMSTKWLDIYLDLGNKYVVDVITTELYDLLLGVKKEMDDEIFSVIKEYQRI